MIYHVLEYTHPGVGECRVHSVQLETLPAPMLDGGVDSGVVIIMEGVGNEDVRLHKGERETSRLFVVDP